MKIQIAGYEGIQLLEKYYTNEVWPLKDFDFHNMSGPIDQGDGSVCICWDIIDLERERLIKVGDYYDRDSGGHEVENAPKSSDSDLYGPLLYDEMLEKTRPFRTYPTAIAVDDVINAIVLDALNASGYKRS